MIYLNSERGIDPQAGELFRRVMTDEDQDNLIGNVTSHLCNAQKRIQLRQAALFCKAEPE
jgi:catalase